MMGIALSRTESHRFRLTFIPAVVLIGVGLYMVILILPLLMSFYYSLTNLNPLYANTRFIGLENYADLFSDTSFRNALVRTAAMSICVTVFANAGGLGIALLLNRSNPFFSFLRTIFFIPQVLSGVIVGFIWIIILTTEDGILNIVLQQIGLTTENIAWLGRPSTALVSLIVVIVWQQIGLCTVIYLAALKGVPNDLLDAARVDGANRLQTFQHVTFPLLAPGMTANVVMLSIITLKLYDQVAVLTAGGPGGSTETLTYYIVRTSFTSNQAGYGSAMALVLFLLMGITSVALTTYLRRREVEY